MSGLSKKKVAILGATGHIAKNIVLGLKEKKKFDICLYARSEAKLLLFLEEKQLIDHVDVISLDDFLYNEYHVIINCIGIGDPLQLEKDPFQIFRLTEKFDNLILEKLTNDAETLYINFSSGAAYGDDFRRPAEEQKSNSVMLNNFSPKDYYGVAKLYSEAKHRCLKTLNIVDLRIFGFFSNYIDLNSRYLLTDIVNSINESKELITSASDVRRDYVHPEDLVELLEIIIDKQNLNDAYDVYSREPISKFELLNYFMNMHHLKYKIIDKDNMTSFTGEKSNYYSIYKKAKEIGYSPRYTSLESVSKEYNHLKKRLRDEKN